MLKKISLVLLMCSMSFAAEFLVLNKDNWMDFLTKQEINARIKANPNFEKEYASRSQRGDIIMVYPDGAFKHKPSANCEFAFIKVPGLPVDKKLVEFWMDPLKPNEVKKYRKYNFDLDYKKQMEKTLTFSEYTVALTDKSLVAKKNEELKIKANFILASILLFNLAG